MLEIAYFTHYNKQVLASWFKPNYILARIMLETPYELQLKTNFTMQRTLNLLAAQCSFIWPGTDTHARFLNFIKGTILISI